MHVDPILTGRRLSGLYAITDPSLMPGEQLFGKSEAALRGGCAVFQYRCKSQGQHRLDEAKRLRDLCHQYGALFIVNDDVMLARAAAADGVHLGQTDTGLAMARDVLGADALIGVSCHSDLALAMRASAQGASYAAFGRFFPSLTKPDAPPASLQVLADAKAQLALPVVAIGGITRDNAPLLVRQGADMIAVIHELFAFDDVEDRARQLAGCFGRKMS